MVTTTPRRHRRRRSPWERAVNSWTRVEQHHRRRAQEAPTPGRRWAYLAGWMWAEVRRMSGKSHQDAVDEVTGRLTRIAEELHERNRPI